MVSRREARLARLGRVTSGADGRRLAAARQRQQSAAFLRHGQLVYAAMTKAGLDPSLCHLMPDVEATGERLAAMPYTAKMRAADEALLEAQSVSQMDHAYYQKLDRDFARLVAFYRDRTPTPDRPSTAGTPGRSIGSASPNAFSLTLVERFDASSPTP